jgi:hypothetical protein
MALTVSLSYVVKEQPDTNQNGLPGAGHSIVLLRQDGFQLHRSWGPTRELALQGLRDYGFAVSEG